MMEIEDINEQPMPPLKEYFSFSGRYDRKTFRARFVEITLFWVLPGMVFAVAALFAWLRTFGPAQGITLWFLAAWHTLLIVLAEYMYAMAMAKRSRDLDTPPWILPIMYFILAFIPLIFFHQWESPLFMTVTFGALCSFFPEIKR